MDVLKLSEALPKVGDFLTLYIQGSQEPPVEFRATGTLKVSAGDVLNVRVIGGGQVLKLRITSAGKTAQIKGRKYDFPVCLARSTIER